MSTESKHSKPDQSEFTTIPWHRHNHHINSTFAMLKAALVLATVVTINARSMPKPEPVPLVATNLNIDHFQQLKQCNANQQLYLPFYLNNLDAANNASSPTVSTDTFHDVPEPALNADAIAANSCFGCSQVHQLLNNERYNISNRNLWCQSNNDCTTNWANTVLRGGCQTVVNKAGSAELTAWVKKWNEWFDSSGSNQIELHHATCGFLTPRCMVLEAECYENQCQFKRNEPVVNELTYPVDVVDVVDGSPVIHA